MVMVFFFKKKRKKNELTKVYDGTNEQTNDRPTDRRARQSAGYLFLFIV